ncbi:MAG: caspase family protein [Bacteroidales bacterium]|nr:caspase family protein [Bacteroidales bacterium]
MKRLILIIIAVLTLCCPTEARTFALLVGMSNYDEPDVTKLSAKDVKDLATILKQTTKDVTVLTSKYATRENVTAKLKKITDTAQKGDRIIFFFNGHGYEGGLGLFKSSLNYSDLVRMLDQAKASEVFVFINACHSGSAGKSVSPDTDSFAGLKAKPGHVYMLSSRSEEFSWSGGWLDKGFFTQALITGLRGKADRDHDYTITVMELFRHIHRDVVRRSEDKQHPMLIAPKSMHELPVIRYPKPENDR